MRYIGPWLCGSVLALASGCSTHFSTLEAEGSSGQTIHVIPEDEAFRLAYSSLANTLPGRKIDLIDGPVRGYTALFRFLLDTYTQQVLVYRAQGKDARGQIVQGYYFDVSGSGSSCVQGRGKNVELFECVTKAVNATGKGVQVSGVECIPYSNSKSHLVGGDLPSSGTLSRTADNTDDIPNKLERLKDLHDRGVISDAEYESKKKQLLERY